MTNLLAKIDMQVMQENAAQATILLKNLANESRLQILCALAATELSVGELNAMIPLSQSALSQHLKRLRQDGLVSTRRASQTIYYSLARSDALKIIEVLHKIYCK
jgi:DNA-binding transcriptional ArsR family regulator